MVDKKKKKKKSSPPPPIEEELRGRWGDGPGTGPREQPVMGAKGDVVGHHSDALPEGCYRAPKMIPRELEDFEP